MESVSRMIVTYLINSAWQLPVVFVVAFLGSLILRRAPARWSHLLWVSALVAGFLLPLWSLRTVVPESPTTLTALDSHTVINADNSAVPATATAATMHRSWFHAANLSPLVVRPRVIWAIGGCYFIFLLYRVVRLAMAARHTWKLRALALDSSDYGDVQCVVEQYSALLGLKASPPVFLSDDVGPLTVGIRRPILLMPSAFCDTASEAEIKAAVCHELAHIKRHDFLLNLACEFMLSPVCYHPFSAVIKARIDRCRELACDDMAAGLMSAPAVYAHSLVSIAKSISTSSVPRLSCGQGLFDTDKLEERVMNLLGTRTIIGNQSARIMAAATLTILAAVSVGAAAFSFRIAQPTVAPAILSTSAADEKPTAQQEISRTQWNVGVQSKPSGVSSPNGENSDARLVIRNFTLKGGEVIPGAQDAISRDLRSRNYGSDISRTLPVWVRLFYLERGYLQAVCSEPEIKQAGASSVDVSISVEPGPQFQLSDIQFTGNTKFTSSELRSLFPIQSGEPFNGAAISAGLDGMRRLYIERGHGEVRYAQSVKAEPSSRTAVVNIVVGDGGNASATPSAESAQDLPGYFKVGNGVTAPVATYQPGPQYNSAAREAKAEGVGVFQIGVGADGTVQTVRPVSGVFPDLHPSLIQSGVDAIRSWKFQPAIKDGQPVPAQIKVQINFQVR